MPSGRGLRVQVVGISSHAKLMIMVFLGMARSAMDWFSFSWNRNVQKIWSLPGPEPSFSVKYHFDYWLKNVLSLVVLSRNFTTHLHLIFYTVMLYPLLTGKHPRLMLPWLYLHMTKNIVTDLVSTTAGVLLCWILHSCGLLALEFLVVRIISMTPSIYLWSCLRSYYLDLYYAELDGEYSFPPMQPNQGLTLAQRRRATKSLDGASLITASPANRSRVNSCLTYDEFFGPSNWEGDLENKISKSLTTLITIESRKSGDVEEDACLQIMHDENLSPAEKTMRFLGLTRVEVDAIALLMHKRTSTTDLGESGSRSFEPSVDGDRKEETAGFPGVGIQVRLPNASEWNIQLKKCSKLSENEEGECKKKCECCEKMKCSKEDDTHSDEERSQSMLNSKNQLRTEKSLYCCDRNRKRKDSDGGKNYLRSVATPTTVLTASTYYKNDLYHGSCLPAVVERNEIAWENLKEINFVSVINKALCNGIKPFKLQCDSRNTEKTVKPNFENVFVDRGAKSKCQNDQTDVEIIPEREDGTKFLRTSHESSYMNSPVFFGPTTASFGTDSDILALNTSFIFKKTPVSGAQSFDSTASRTKQLVRPDHESEIESHFISSFQRHSNMFDYTRVQPEPLNPLQFKVHSVSAYRVVHRVNDDSSFYRTGENYVKEKTDGSSYSLGFCNSRSNAPQYQRNNSDGRDLNRINLTGNDIDVIRDIPENTKSQGLEVSDSEIYSSSLEMAEKFFPSNSQKENNTLTRASQTPSTMFEAVRKAEMISKYTCFENESNINSDVVLQIEGRSSHSKSSHQKGLKIRQSLASSSRSSRTRETPEERETKDMQALKAYNEKTLLKYKREMDARNQHERALNKFRDSLPRRSPDGTNGNGFNQVSCVPSVPELEKPEKDMILRIENSYGRFTRSKPVDPVKSEALHGNCMTKEFFDIYNNDGRLKKDSRKIKLGDKMPMRKQHSKYSKLSEITNESDVTSRSCKRIDGLQKGRDLDRTLYKENIRARNMQVYFFERQFDDKPSTSKNVTVTAIKSFSRQVGTDPTITVSSEILTSNGTQSPTVEVPNKPEEIPCRINDSEYYTRLRKSNIRRNIKKAVDNIDWSFQRPISTGNDRHRQKSGTKLHTEMMITGLSSERQDIVHKTTESMLQSIFSNSENSERGFRLGDSANEYYPIFSRIAVDMEEIARDAAPRGCTNEFSSQPDTEIEIPDIENGQLYGLTTWSSGLRRRSSSGFLRCGNVTGNIGSITTSTALDHRENNLEVDSMDQDETISHEDGATSTLLSKLISSTEINVPVIGPEDAPEEPKDTSEALPHSVIRDLDDYSSFLFNGLAEPKKSIISSRYHNSEDSLQVRLKKKRISSERVRLALHNVISQSPGLKILDTKDSQFKYDIASYQDILNQFNIAGEKEVQSIVLEFFGQYPSCTIGSSAQDLLRNLKGTEFVEGFQMLTNLYAIETKAGQIAGREHGATSEESSSSNSGNSAFQRNDQSERGGTSGRTNFGNTSANNSARSRDREQEEDGEWKGNDWGRRVIVEANSNPDRGSSSSEKLHKTCDDDKRLLSNISEPESGLLEHLELMNRTNFRREVINSVFLKAIKQSTGSSDSSKGTEAEIFAPRNVDKKIQSDSLTDEDDDDDDDDDDDVSEKVTSQSALTCPKKEMLSIDVDNVTLNVLKDIESAEGAIKKMKAMFERYFQDGQGREEIPGEQETFSKMKNLSRTSLRLPVIGEFRKLQNLVQTVANYVAITGCSSRRSIKLSNEAVVSDIPKEELNATCRSETSNNLEAMFEILPKNEVKSNIDNCQPVGVAIPAIKGSPKNSGGKRYGIARFSSWDKVIPLSTKCQIEKSKRKSKPKRVVAVREPPRRVLKVVKLIEEKDLDFFSARSVPQRGRGLSSGYLMDSDSDGNFTVSRPPTPVSTESEISQTFSCDHEDPEVFSNPLKDSAIIPMSDTPYSRTTDHLIESCWSSSSSNPIKGMSRSTKNPNSTNALAEKLDDDVESLQTSESLEVSRSLIFIDAEASSPRGSVLPGIVGVDESTQNAFCYEDSHLLGAGSLSTESDLRFMSSADAAVIRDKMKDVMQQILNHQFSGLNALENEFRIASKNVSFTSLANDPRTDFSIDLQSTQCDPKEGLEEKENTKQECYKRIQKLLSKADNTSMEQLNAYYKDLDLISKNSGAESFEVLPRKSTTSVREVAIGTEYNKEVFKDLLDTFERICSIREKAMPGQDFFSSPVNVAKKFNAQELAIVNYDSFDSLYFQNTIKRSEPSCPNLSLSDHTYFEEFPEQVDSRLLLLTEYCEENTIVIGESIESKYEVNEGSSKKELSLSNSDESGNHFVLTAPSSSQSNAKSKDVTRKKTGIPRPVKDSKGRK